MLYKTYNKCVCVCVYITARIQGESEEREIRRAAI